VDGDVNASVADPQSAGVAELRALLTPAGVELRNPGLYVTEQGMVHGQLTYSGPVEGEILAELPHEPVYQQVITQTDLPTLTENDDFARGVTAYFSQVLREFVTLGLIGILTLLVAPRALQAPIPALQMRLLPSLGVGLITFILSFPTFLIIIILSVALVLVLSLLQLRELTLISSLLAAVFDFSTIGLFYFVTFMITRVIVSFALGRFIIRQLTDNTTSIQAGIISLLLGIAILALFASLPLVGWLVSALAVFLGLGAILILLQEELEKVRAAPVAAPTDSIEAQQVPPPMVEDSSVEPGTENLPEGFKWWK
jgi:hypothetical protein